MPGHDGLEPVGVERAGFDELQQPGLVLRPPGLEREGGEMFRGENARRSAFDIHLDGFREGFFRQRPGRRQELDGPAANDDIFTLHGAASGLQVIVDGPWADQEIPRIGPEGDEDIHVQRRDRLQIERRANGSADGVALDHAIRLHLVDRNDDFLDVHGHNLSRGKHGIQFIQQLGQLVAEELVGLAEAALLVERREVEVVGFDAEAGGDVVAD